MTLIVVMTAMSLAAPSSAGAWSTAGTVTEADLVDQCSVSIADTVPFASLAITWHATRALEPDETLSVDIDRGFGGDVVKTVAIDELGSPANVDVSSIAPPYRVVLGHKRTIWGDASMSLCEVSPFANPTIGPFVGTAGDDDLRSVLVAQTIVSGLGGNDTLLADRYTSDVAADSSWTNGAVNWWQRLYGGDGDDTLTIDRNIACGTRTTLNGGDGVDHFGTNETRTSGRRVTCDESINDAPGYYVATAPPVITMLGGDGNDVISGPSNGRKQGNKPRPTRTPHTVIRGGDGNDEIHGYDARVEGNAGNDTITAAGQGYEQNWAFGGPGRDIMVGRGSATLDGGPGADRLDLFARGSGTGGAGRDVLICHRCDEMNGGRGDDIFRVARIGNGVTQNGGPGDDRLVASTGTDNLSGDDGDDILTEPRARERHRRADDKFYGGRGNDRIHAGNGPDYILDDSGRDHVWGGAGNDWINTRGSSRAIYAEHDQKPDVVDCGAGYDIARVGTDDVTRHCEYVTYIEQYNPCKHGAHCTAPWTDWAYLPDLEHTM